MIKTLERLKDGEEGVVRTILGGHGIRQRLNHFGVHPGDKVRIIQDGFLGGPVLIAIHGAEVAIGQGMARKIEVEVSDS
jgi:ferrous iron transport protein A